MPCFIGFFFSFFFWGGGGVLKKFLILDVVPRACANQLILHSNAFRLFCGHRIVGLTIWSIFLSFGYR